MAKNVEGAGGHITLKDLSEHLGLHPATVSVVLNEVPGRAVPAKTRKRIKDAAHEFGYVPNGLARSLRTGKTRNIGVILPELSHGPYASIVNGLGNRLTQNDYCYMALHHGHNPTTVAQSIEILQTRGVEGLIVIDAILEKRCSIPTVTIGCRGSASGGAKIVFDEHRAVALALEFFRARGRRRVSLLRARDHGATEDELANTVRKTAEVFNLEIVDEEAAYDQISLEPEESSSAVLGRQELGNRDAILTFDMRIASSTVALSRRKGTLNDDACPVVCIDCDGSARPEPGMAVVRHSLDAVGQLSADTILRWVSSFDDYAERVLTVQPELIYGAPNWK